MFKIRRLQIEVTMKCVEEPCKFCNRNLMKIHDVYYENSLKTNSVLEVFKKNNIDYIHFTGAAGEAAYHNNFTKIIQCAREESNIGIDWNSNGYPKDDDWWYEVGKLLNRENDIIQFALDGIDAKTHNLHRHNDFDTVYSHMLSYIKGGGNASWQFIVFKHNEHQLDSFVKLAKEIGCKQIIIRNSKRYDDELKPPTTLNYNCARTILFNEQLPKNIKCVSLPPNNECFIDASSYLWPCCAFAGEQQLYNVYKKSGRRNPLSDTLIKIFEAEKLLLSIDNESRLDKIIKKSKLFKYIHDNIYNEECCNKYCNINREFDTKFSRVINF